MAEIDKLISFNGLHVIIFIFTYNLLMNNGSLLEYIGGYILRIESPTLWFFCGHILVAYLILTKLTFELGFRAAIKFKP